MSWRDVGRDAIGNDSTNDIRYTAREEKGNQQMTKVPTPTLYDIPAAEAKKLKKLLFERDFLGYALSYAALSKLLGRYIPDDTEMAEMLSGCIAAFTSEDETTAKDELRGRIGDIFLNHDIKSVRHEDMFGRNMDCVLYESTSGAKLDKTRMLELAPKFGISITKLKELMDAATEPGKPFVAMKVVEVKEKSEKG